MSESMKTTDHQTIRRWVEERNGHPAHVKRTDGGDDASRLRIDLAGSGDDELEEISWDEFFRAFDEGGLAFLYREKTDSGQLSNFNEFIQR